MKLFIFIILFAACSEIKLPTPIEWLKFYQQRLKEVDDSAAVMYSDNVNRYNADLPVNEYDYKRLYYEHLCLSDSVEKYQSLIYSH